MGCGASQSNREEAAGAPAAAASELKSQRQGAAGASGTPSQPVNEVASKPRAAPPGPTAPPPVPSSGDNSSGQRIHALDMEVTLALHSQEQEVRDVAREAEEQLRQDLKDEKGILQLATSFATWLGLSSAPGKAKIDIAKLQLPERSGAEKKLQSYSALGQVLVGLAQHAASALPFGGPVVAAAIGGLYSRAAQAAKNSNNCERLLKRVKLCDRQLAKLVKHKQAFPVDELKETVVSLLDLLQEAGQILAAYSNEHFLMRMLSSSKDSCRFQELDEGIRDCVQEISLTLSVGAATAPQLSLKYEEEASQLRASVCEATGLPEGCSDKELQGALEGKGSAQLFTLLQESSNFSNKVVAAALQSLGMEMKEQLKRAEERLDKLESRALEDAAKGPEAMAAYLESWWGDRIGRLKKLVSFEGFVAGVVAWFNEQQSCKVSLHDFDEELKSEGLLMEPGASGSFFSGTIFLHVVVKRLLDADGSGTITRSELCRLHLLAVEFARKPDVRKDTPQTLPSLLEVLYLGFDRRDLIKELLAPKRQGAGVDLNITEVIRSYNISALLNEYHPGSRAWMYEEVEKWLDACSSSRAAARPGCDQGQEQGECLEGGSTTPSRLFLLLADPGMGKSVFSAVMDTKLFVRANTEDNLVIVKHFFKVGQRRAQGQVMVLCVAQQLAQRLPGFAAALAPAVEEHGDGSKLQMQDAFNAFLLEPLTSLHGKRQQAAAGRPGPHVLILLDALDESDEAGQGWGPVMNLIAEGFVKLPEWVHIMVTGRPEVEASFSKWRRSWIRPEAAQNQADMLELLKLRLQQRRLLPEHLLDQAAALMLAKSQGQFIYIKFAFEELALKEQWTLAEMRARLPSGLAGTYKYLLGLLVDVLEETQPALLQLLMDKVLPTLVASRDPLTPAELAWVVGAEPDTVARLVRLLANLFPCSGGSSAAEGDARIRPYHKSVLDWLTCTDGMDSGVFRVDAAAGHRLLAQACVDLIAREPQAVLMPGISSSSLVVQASMSAVTGGEYVLRHSFAHICTVLSLIPEEGPAAPQSLQSSLEMLCLLPYLLAPLDCDTQLASRAPNLQAVHSACVKLSRIAKNMENLSDRDKDSWQGLCKAVQASFLPAFSEAEMELLLIEVDEVIALLAASSSSKAQQTHAMILRRKGTALRDLGRYDESVAALQEAKGLVEGSGPGLAQLELIMDLTELAGTLDYIGDIAKGMPFSEEAASMARAFYGQEVAHPVTASCLTTLGYFLKGSGMHPSARGQEGVAHLERAVETFKQACDMRMRVFGPMHLEVSSSLHMMGICMVALKRYEDAESCLLKSLEIRTAQLQQNHYQLANTHRELASLYKASGKLDLQVKSWESMLFIACSCWGERHKKTVSCANELARAYKEQGNFESAQELEAKFELSTAIWLFGK